MLVENDSLRGASGLRDTSLVVSGREQGFSTIVSVGLLFGASGRGQDFSFTKTSACVPCWRHAFQIIARLFQQFVVQVHGCLEHFRVRLTSDIAKAISQCTSALVEVPESLCQFIRVPKGLCSTRQVWSWHLLLSDSCFQHNSDRDFPLVVASNAQTRNQTRKRVANTQLVRNRGVSGRFSWTARCIPSIFRHGLDHTLISSARALSWKFPNRSASSSKIPRLGSVSTEIAVAPVALSSWSLWKVIFLVTWVLDIQCTTFRMFWSWSFPTACHRVGHKNVSTRLGLDRRVVEKL